MLIADETEDHGFRVVTSTAQENLLQCVYITKDINNLSHFKIAVTCRTSRSQEGYSAYFPTRMSGLGFNSKT